MPRYEQPKMTPIERLHEDLTFEDTSYGRSLDSVTCERSGSGGICGASTGSTVVVVGTIAYTTSSAVMLLAHDGGLIVIADVEAIIISKANLSHTCLGMTYPRRLGSMPRWPQMRRAPNTGLAIKSKIP